MKAAIGKEGMSALHSFIIVEITIAVFPALVAMCARVLLGSPSVNEWKFSSLLLLVVAFVAWFVYQLVRSLNVRNALVPLERYYADPLFIKTGLTATLWSRKSLKWLAEIEPDEFLLPQKIELKSMIKSNDDGRKSLDKEGVLENAKEVGIFISEVGHATRWGTKTATKATAGYLQEKLDSTITRRTEAYLGVNSSVRYTLIFHLFFTFIPVIAIYSLN